MRPFLEVDLLILLTPAGREVLAFTSSELLSFAMNNSVRRSSEATCGPFADAKVYFRRTAGKWTEISFDTCIQQQSSVQWHI